ncbi:MAG: hypothetical protein Q8M44_02315 [bacterium]|nr:hypothetical protein [bacterium]
MCTMVLIRPPALLPLKKGEISSLFKGGAPKEVLLGYPEVRGDGLEKYTTFSLP